jgi:hypothetical protein
MITKYYFYLRWLGYKPAVAWAIAMKMVIRDGELILFKGV